MPKGQLIINNHDAYTDYGISLEEAAMSSLLTPPPMKARVESRYRKKHGKTTINKTPRYDDRDLTLAIHINARTQKQFLEYYYKFCTEILATGHLDIKTSFEPDVVYKCDYISCNQFAEFNMEYAAFTLKLNEPNPADRSEEE